MSREAYIPPEFDKTQLTPMPLAAIGEAVLRPGISITGVGGFVDLNTIQYNVIRSMQTSGPLPPLAQELFLRRVIQQDAELTPLGSTLRPKQFNGNIVEGAVHVLSFDRERVGIYSREAGKRTVRTAVSLLLVGSLGSRGGEVSPPFLQEISYVFGGQAVGRYIAPRDSLRAAAVYMTSVRGSSKQVGGLTDTDVSVSTMHPLGHPRRAPGEDRRKD
jgi:hypothetical protein